MRRAGRPRRGLCLQFQCRRDRARKLGLEVVANESYNAKSTDLSPVVLKLKAAKPDVILAASIGADAIVLCKQLRELDVNPSAIIGTFATETACAGRRGWQNG